MIGRALLLLAANRRRKARGGGHDENGCLQATLLSEYSGGTERSQKERGALGHGGEDPSSVNSRERKKEVLAIG